MIQVKDGKVTSKSGYFITMGCYPWYEPIGGFSTLEDAKLAVEAIAREERKWTGNPDGREYWCVFKYDNRYGREDVKHIIYRWD